MDTEIAEKHTFETGIYRPPSEGGSYSLLLRITRNCPWNKCTFCGMYKGEKFMLRSSEEIKKDIDSISAICNGLKTISRDLGYGGELNRDVVIEMIGRNPALNTRHGFSMVLEWLFSGGKTAFLQDANSLMMKSEKLVDILKYLRRTFPSLDRVTSYARSKTLARKNQEELKNIYEAGLDRLHVGLETGDDKLLAKVKKGVSSEEHIAGGRKAMKAGFQLSEYWMPGLGGKERWQAHAKGTARVLNEINPDYVRSRPFFPFPGTPLYEEHASGELQMLSPREQLTEVKLMIEDLEVTSRVCFDHMANYWRNKNGGLLFSQDYEGYKFPEKKSFLLQSIEEAIETQESL
jgi:radical SAM superfamily enzyme YgiQ (UPF0313 family)